MTSEREQEGNVRNPFLNLVGLWQNYLIGWNEVNRNFYGNAIKTKTEQKLYEQSVIAASQYSKLIEAYDFVTILLIIGVGLGGIAEIAKNKLLGYAGLVVGGLGVVVLLLISFVPAIVWYIQKEMLNEA